MAQISQASLYSWEDIDTASDLDRLRLVLAVLPDEELMRALEERRGNGRNEYPIRAVWNAILAGIVFQHPTIAALRRDLSRNGQLRDLCGLDPLRGVDAIPTDSAFSHFLDALLELETKVRALFHDLVERLLVHIPDLGETLAHDGKALPSFGRPLKKEESVRLREDGQPDRRADPDADWGVKTKRGKRPDGSTWEKASSWFGYELHLLIDSQHELPVNFQLTKASIAESPELLQIVQDTKDRHPQIIDNARELSADKGYDSANNNQNLLDEFNIAPIIDIRNSWHGTDTTRPLFPDRIDTVVYDFKGTISCVCPATGELRKMANWGYESDRQGLKYRCPAVANGFTCAGRDQCPGAQSGYGRVVRIPLDQDRRMFVPIARDSDSWKKSYARRTAVERVNSRIDNVLGFERHTIRGLKKMETRVGLALVVLLAMALGRTQSGQRVLMRSVVAPPIRRAA